MIQNSGTKKLNRVSSIAFVGVIQVFVSKSALAQSRIIPDATMGNENSQVRTNVNVKGLPSEVIEGGAQRGANLFHSFSEFNISEGRGAYFANPGGIEQIFSRVTGANPSEILGTLGVLGSADLFLINPNGIIFGENARLDVGGSFVGTTADGVRLGETGLFSASEPQKSNLLTVNPSALFFNAMAAGKIINRSQALGIEGETNSNGAPVGLRVPNSKTLALVGGDVFLQGGNLTAAGGRIELGSVAGVGEVSLSQNGHSWVLRYNKNNTFGSIQLDGAFVDASGSGGGNVQIQGARFEMLGGSFLVASTLGSENGGRVLVRTTEAVTLSDNSLLAANVFGSGDGADIRLETGELTVKNGALIGTVAVEGDGGSLTIDATESVDVIGISADGQFPSSLFSQTLGAGAAGNLTLETSQLTLQDGARLSTSTRGEGNGGILTVKASESVEVIGTSVDGRFFSRLTTQTQGAGVAGNLTLETGRLTVRNGGRLFTGTLDVGTFNEGDGGSLTIDATESVEVIGTGISANGQLLPSGLFVSSDQGGAAGNLILETRKLTVRDGAQISAGTFGSGDGGTLTVKASESVEVIGRSADGQIASQLDTQTQGAGAAGNLILETKQLTVQDGAQIGAGTFGSGDGGTLVVEATESVELIGMGISADGQLLPSGLFTETLGEGNAGNLTLETRQLTVQDGARISAGTFSSGDGGNGSSLIVKATESVELIGTSPDGLFPTGLFTQTLGEGNAGNLTIETGQLTVQDGAQIITSTFDRGDAGTLTINATESVEVIGTSSDGQSLSGFFSSVQPGATGNANNLTINTERLLVSDGAVLTANTLGQGNAGDLTVTTSQLTLQNQGELLVSGQGDFDPGNLTINADNITLDNQSSIVADTESGNFGNIILNIQDLLTLRRESQIRTNAIGTATGGNITINAPDGFIIAVPEENSDITANARQAKGGRVFIDATNLFGIEPREQTTPESDITATSELGSEFSGTVEINTPDVDPNRGLIQLPTQPLETEVAQACTPGSSGQSEFFITGRGGLPHTPNDTLSSDAIGVDLVTLDSDAVEGQGSGGARLKGDSSQFSVPHQIIEAQGIIVDENGDVVLVASVPNTASPSSWQNQPQCDGK